MRIEKWEDALYSYLAEKEKCSFEYGVNDCSLFAGGYLDLVTGSNLKATHEGQYSTAEESQEYLELIGFSSNEEFADSLFESIHIKKAGRGDIVYFAGALGICDGRRSFFFVEGKGLVALPTLSCNKAWRV